MEKYNKDNVSIILQMKVDSLQEEKKTGKNQEDKFAKDVAQLEIDGKITREDIIAIQHHGIRGADLLNILGNLDRNKESKFTWNEAKDLGHKIQLIYMSHHMKQGRTDGSNLFRESMKPHEDGIDAIYNGTYPIDKLNVLKSLPNIDGWDHELGDKAYHKIF